MCVHICGCLEGIGLSFLFIFKNLFISVWLWWVFVATLRLSLVVPSGATLWLQCESISFVGASAVAEHAFSGSWASVVEGHGSSCLVASGIFLDRGSNPVPCIGRQILNH